MQRWIPILMYHRVTSASALPGLAVSPHTFERQLAFLHRLGYQGLTLTQMLNGLEGKTKLPTRPVVLTFDDGYQDNFSDAWPLLQKYNFPATIFLVSDFVGRDSSFDNESPPEYGLTPMLTPAQILEMAQGGIEFGSHTARHRALPALPKIEQLQELDTSRKTLTTLLNQEVTTFAYPYSRVDAASETAVAEAGYRAAVAGRGPHFRSFCLNRLDPTFMSLPALALLMSPTVRNIRKNPSYVAARQLIYKLGKRVKA